MADKDVKIHIGTEADTKGAQEAQDALNRVKDAAAGIAPASPEPQSIVPSSIIEEADATAAALDDLTDAAKETDDALRPSTPPTIVPSTLLDEATAAGISLEDLTDAAEEADKALRPSTPPTIIPANLAPDAKKAEEALDQVSQANVRIIDTTKRSTDAIDENKRAFAEWQAQRNAARKGSGTSALASDPAEFYEAEAEALRKVQAAEQEAIRTKQAAIDATNRQRLAKQEARDAARQLRMETQALDQAQRNKNRALQAGATAMTSLAGRMGGLTTIIRSVINPYALLGTAIGVATAAGMRMWQKLTEGAEKAKTPLEEYSNRLEELDHLLEESRKEALDSLVTGGRDAFDRLQRGFEERDFRARVAVGGDELEKIRIEGAARVAIAKERFELLKIETNLARSSGEEAVRLAKEREGSIKRILELEEGVTAQLREQELSVLRRKVEEAKTKLDDTELPLAGAQNRASAIQSELAEARKAGRDATLLRQRIIFQLQDELFELRKQRVNLRKAFEGAGSLRRLDLKKDIDQVQQDIRFREKRVSELSFAPENETSAIKRGEELSKHLAAANEDLKRMTEAQEAASMSLRDATLALREASDKQSAQTETESALKQTKEAEDEFKKIQTKLDSAEAQAGQKIAQSLADILDKLDDAANDPAVQEKAERLTEMLKDGLQRDELDEASQLLMQLMSKTTQRFSGYNEMVRKIIELTEGHANTTSILKGQLDELGRKLRRLEENARHPSY